MKRGVIVLLLLGILLVSPLVLAQEQAQTYAGFDRFVDDVRMFFSFGDNKVMLALEIREKEINSAMVNNENGDDKEAEKNIERAWKRLQFIQEKVSFDTAEEVKENSKEVRENIIGEENLPDDFDVYVLEEEKTGLTAEWVMEFEGEEGQILTREVVTNMEQNRVMEIENRIDEIDGEISNWVVEHTYAEGTGAGGEAGVVVGGGLTNVIKTEVAQGDDGLKLEVKIHVEGDGTDDSEVVNHVDSGGMAPGTSGGTDTTVGDVPGSDDASLDDNIDDVTGEPITDQIDNGEVLDDTDASDDVEWANKYETQTKS